MGAADFGCKAVGKTAQDAFRHAREDAEAENGHREGYSGAINAKSSFTIIQDTPEQIIPKLERRVAELPEGDWGRSAAAYSLDQLKKAKTREEQVYAMADALLTLEDSRVKDKYGPAGCFELGEEKAGAKGFYFFGWAAS